MISLVFAAVLMAGAPAAGEPAQATAAAPAKSEKAKPAPNEMVCKKEPVLGSRMKSRICMTQADWDARELQDREDLGKSQRQQPLIVG
jgi:predicted secreted protein